MSIPCEEECEVCKKDTPQKALEHDPNAIEVYKEDSKLGFGWACTDTISDYAKGGESEDV